MMMNSYPEVYAVTNKNEGLREKSSSGGVFSALADAVISNGGVVFGAAFSKDFKNVEMTAADNENDLEKLRGSKYSKANVGDTYREAVEYLRQGREVFYTGSACHIAGLKKYLAGKFSNDDQAWDNLYTMDIICHGACVPDLWRKYLEYREGRADAKAKNVSFRNKRLGWHDFSLSIEFDNGLRYERSFKSDYYYHYYLYMENIALMPLCYACPYKGIDNRIADITAGDFWGCENISPELDDNRGLSLALTNSRKGKILIERAKKYLNIYALSEVKKKAALDRNSFLRVYPDMHPRHEEFMKDLDMMNFEQLGKKYIESKADRLNRQVMLINFCHRDFPVNYGQTLLGFALYRAVENFGYQPIIAAYTKRPDWMRGWYYTRYYFPDRKTHFSKSFSKTTDVLKQQEIRVVQCFDETDIFRLSEICDRYIVGGDAVWRPAHYDPVFYLNFGRPDKLRISYAASIANYDEEQRQTYCQMFTQIENNLDYISTREEKTVSYMQELAGIERAVNVCDPVFLLDRPQWEAVEHQPHMGTEERYVIAYIFSDAHEYDSIIEAVKKKYSCNRVIWIPTGSTLDDRKISENGIGADEFIWLIHHAAAVVTNSFHGMAFSILFERDFFIIKRKEESLKGDVRFSDLLEMTGLEARQITEAEEVRKMSATDWTKKRGVMADYIRYSRAFLAMALDDAENKKRL